MGSLRRTLGPLLLIVLCPPSVMLLWHAIDVHDGSLLSLGRAMVDEGPAAILRAAWGSVFFGSRLAWTAVGAFVGVQLLLMRVVPGRRARGPMTATGHVPVYRDNGLACFGVTLVLFWLGAGPLGLFPATLIYDHFGEILGALNVGALVFCLLLYLKGLLAPSTRDSGTTGNPVFDYYWGTELYPRILGWDVKQLVICRFGMMAWPLILVSCAARQQESHGLSSSMALSVGLQMVYIAKFFVWEAGYLRSLDIIHDRAGFYTMWGCLVWLPGLYPSPTLYLVEHPHRLGPVPVALLAAAGLFAIVVNYLADRQRQRVRETDGRCTIWGRQPVIIRASYATDGGERRESVLLASGWWGVARHFHYVPEIAAALIWSLPALFDHLLPYVYVIFLTALLVHRAFRDDARCARKYGADWDRYRAVVRYRILPGLI